MFNSSQVTFIYIVLYTRQIVSKQLYSAGKLFIDDFLLFIC